MFMPRHPKPLLSTKAVATMVVQQRQQHKIMDKHLLIVETPATPPEISAPAPAAATALPRPTRP